MKHLSILTLMTCTSLFTYAQSKYSKEVEEKIKQVENNIAFVKFQIEGKPNATIEERMALHHIKGLSIAIIHNYQIEWAKGYGWADSTEQRPVSTETRFIPGSISKSINAVGVLKLAQDGKVELNKDINTYLTSWKFSYDSVSKNKKITIANLLSHTGGLNVHGFWGYKKGDALPSIPQLLDGKKPANSPAVRSIFEPGLRSEYSGGGIMISQLIAMDVSQQAYDTYMWEHVLQPIGMNNSSFAQVTVTNKQLDLATGYTTIVNPNGKEVEGKYPILAEQAAGGLWTTATDLAKFIIEIQLSLDGKSNKVLSKKMTKKMLKPYIDNMTALGFFIENRGRNKWFQHAAGNVGFGGKYYGSFEDGNGVVVLVNSDNGEALIDEVITSVANTYQWKGLYNQEKPITRKVVTIPEAIQEKYVGTYKQNGAVATISKNAEGLWYQTIGAPWKMYFTSNTDFFNLEAKTDKHFYADSSGNINGFSKRIDNKEFGKAERINVISLSESLLDTYTGNYIETTGDTIPVIKKDNCLYMDLKYVQKKMSFTSNTEFFAHDDFGIEYMFITNKDGQIESIDAKMNNQRKSLKRIK